MTFDEALLNLNITEDKLQEAIDNDEISYTLVNGAYEFTNGAILAYMNKKTVSKGTNNKKEKKYIPICDIEMLVNDEYEKNITK